MCAPEKKKSDSSIKDCMIKYIIKYNQPAQFMEEIIPTVEIRKG